MNMAQKQLKVVAPEPLVMENPKAIPAAARDGESLGIETFKAVDRIRDAVLGKLTGGISPGSVAMANFDWAIHLASAPGKRMELAAKAARKSQRFLAYLLSTAMDPKAPPVIEPLPGDNRFSDPAWEKPPFNLMAQAFLL